MKELKVKEQKDEFKSWIIPGNSLGQEEFSEGIRKAENGPFYTVQQSMESFELWLKAKEK